MVIFSLSGPSYSAAASAGFIARIAALLAIGFLRSHVGVLNLMLRKTAHLTEYAIFAVCLYGAIKPSGRKTWSGHTAMLAVMASAAYSLTDEFHQIFVPGRHASLIDCLVDTTGACCGLWILFRTAMALSSTRRTTSFG